MIIPSTGRHILSSDGPKHSWKLAQGLLSWHRTEIVKNGKFEIHYTILLLNFRSKKKYIFVSTNFLAIAAMFKRIKPFQLWQVTQSHLFKGFKTRPRITIVGHTCSCCGLITPSKIVDNVNMCCDASFYKIILEKSYSSAVIYFKSTPKTLIQWYIIYCIFRPFPIHCSNCKLYHRYNPPLLCILNENK